MTFSKILNNKVIAVLALIFIAIEAVPTIAMNPNPIIFFKIILWLFGAVFVWLNKDWAAIFLASLAVLYFVIDIVLSIPKFASAIHFILSQPASVNRSVPFFIILSVVIEISFLLCFIFYGIMNIKKKLKTN